MKNPFDDQEYQKFKRELAKRRYEERELRRQQQTAAAWNPKKKPTPLPKRDLSVDQMELARIRAQTRVQRFFEEENLSKPVLVDSVEYEALKDLAVTVLEFLRAPTISYFNENQSQVTEVRTSHLDRLRKAYRDYEASVGDAVAIGRSVEGLLGIMEDLNGTGRSDSGGVLEGEEPDRG